MALENISIGELRHFLSRVMIRNLTINQRKILSHLEIAQTCFSKTQCVKIIASEVGCAESTVWDNLSIFEELGILSGKGIEFTEIGLICLSVIGDKNVLV